MIYQLKLELRGRLRSCEAELEYALVEVVEMGLRFTRRVLESGVRTRGIIGIFILRVPLTYLTKWDTTWGRFLIELY